MTHCRVFGTKFCRRNGPARRKQSPHLVPDLLRWRGRAPSRRPGQTTGRRRGRTGRRRCAGSARRCRDARSKCPQPTGKAGSEKSIAKNFDSTHSAFGPAMPDRRAAVRQVGDRADLGQRRRRQSAAARPSSWSTTRNLPGAKPKAAFVSVAKPPPAPSGSARPATSAIAAIIARCLAAPGGELDDRARLRSRSSVDADAVGDIAVRARPPRRLQRRKLVNHACASLPGRRNGG